MKIFRAVEKGLEIPENLDDLDLETPVVQENTQETSPETDENSFNGESMEEQSPIDTTEE
jgi:hypothetical protein